MHSRFFLLLVFLVMGWQSAYGIIFERRSRPEPQLAYFVYPIVGSIPGVQDFYGLGATVAGIGGSDVDITGVHLEGDAEYFDGNFSIDILTILDIPLLTKHLTFSAFYVDIRNGSYPEGERGIDSDPDNIYLLLGEEIKSQGGEISLNFFENQVELYYGFLDASVKPFGLVDPNDNFYSAEEADIVESPRAYRYGFYLDDTDDRRDPRIGYRIQLERYDVPASRGENSAFYQDDYNLTTFIPVLPERSGVLVLNQFLGTSTVTKKGTVDRDRFTCADDAPAECQIVLDELYDRQVAEAENGKATSLGGTNRLRGYPTNRFFDSYTFFRGAEFRWYMLEVQNAFDYIVQRGIFAGFQLAFFYEEGTVAPKRSEIWENSRTSRGIGARFLFNTIIVRVDRGFSDEGGETTVFVGYPF